ncbi:MAG: alkaline phosphatase family protein [Ignavibacteriae bacterium]|nr:alkaline phosphatase family protein [Ignavibacteria bacterium]MBI3363438.1 alkaline phosphatase family protein [Ignavibacteriota bacterium]
MRKSPHVLFLFVDGVGIGRNDPAINPFFAASLQAFESCMGGKMMHLADMNRTSDSMSLVPLDATLGVEGLPQSGTGQTSLFTGVNAARMIGKHFGPHPYSSLKPIIREKSIFRQVRELGKSSYFANAFPRQYFQHVEVNKSRVTATTLAWLATGDTLNDPAVLRAGDALSADITNERWDRLGYPDMPVVTAQEAGRRLVSLTRKHDFVLYEYYFTDHAGHHQSMSDAIEVLRKLDEFLEGILSVFERDTMLLFITSDHGNLEDLSTKGHTRNPVPLLVVGDRHREVTERATDLTHVAPAILSLFH